ncbi:4534_t:CDS:1 [Scutellospora calospora]|uniref:4534_t:CDS:1 n=1 Tax=Scutellospora calospora TaxID=85575 RepID=A0ACA9N232_9GLOM|nr:4534_t:CDS:1 [Scutellospora calospora]
MGKNKHAIWNYLTRNSDGSVTCDICKRIFEKFTKEISIKDHCRNNHCDTWDKIKNKREKNKLFEKNIFNIEEMVEETMIIEKEDLNNDHSSDDVTAMDENNDNIVEISSEKNDKEFEPIIFPYQCLVKSIKYDNEEGLTVIFGLNSVKVSGPCEIILKEK